MWFVLSLSLHTRALYRLQFPMAKNMCGLRMVKLLRKKSGRAFMVNTYEDLFSSILYGSKGKAVHQQQPKVDY